MSETLIPIEEVISGASSVRDFKEIEALLAKSGRTKANASYVTPVTNGTSQKTTPGKHFPMEGEGPSEVDANTEAVYKLVKYKKAGKESTPEDGEKNNMKWAFYIDGILIKNNLIDYIKFMNKEKEAAKKDESATDFMAIEDDAKRTEAIIKYAFLYKKGEIKDGTVTLTLKYSKWLDGHDVVIEAYRGKPDKDKSKAYAVLTSVKAKPEVIDVQWANKKELPIKFSDYSQEKYLKISTLGLKDKTLDITLNDGTLQSKQPITFTAVQQKKSVKIEGRTTIKEISVLHKNEHHEHPLDEIIYQIQNPKTLSNDEERPELQLEVKVKKDGENIINAADKLVFAQYLNVYPKEKILDTYFAVPKKTTAKKEDGTTEEATIYEKVDELSIGQKTYLVADCVNLGDKTVKLKIHEKADANGKLLIQANEEDYFKVCKPKAANATTYTELPKNDWIEGTVDKETNQVVVELVMRPKTRNMASDSEALAKSLEGWKEGLYHREDETPAGIQATQASQNQATARANEAFVTLTRDADADKKENKKSFPKTISGPKTIEVGKEAIYILENYKPGATEADKKNIQWSLYKQGDPKTDYTVINTKSKTGLYAYAKMELTGGKNKLTIYFDEALKGKKIQIEPFRGSPDITQPPNRGYIKTVTIQEKEKSKLINKLTTNVFVSAECCEGEEGDISYINKKGVTKLQHGELLFPFNSIPQNHPDNFKTRYYKPYNYRLTEHKAPTFGVLRSPARIHAARDLYSDVGESIYAIADGVVTDVHSFYRDTWRIEIEHEYEETKFAKTKGNKMVVRYGEVKKGGAILVKKGDRVFRGDKIAEVGLLVPYVHQPGGEKRGMLHIEFYTGEEKGNLSDTSVLYSKMKYATSGKYNGTASFQRRIDLFDGLYLLDKMLETSQKENRIE